MTTPKTPYPGWRSLLFIPVHIDKFVDKAHTRGADAYVLDMEDSVPLAEKALARTKVKEAAKKAGQAGAGVLVRINLDWEMAREDLEAAVIPEVSCIVLPKVESASQVQRIDALLTSLEQKAGITPGTTRLLAMIESVEALPVLDDIASASHRIMAMTIGSEDFSASAGMKPLPETLYFPCQQLVFACRRHEVEPLGFPGSIAAYDDLDGFTRIIQQGQAMGFSGALCIHPKQVAILNEVLTPSEDEIARAKGLIEAYEQGLAEGKGAVEYRGKMIDLPVVLAARKVIQRHALLNGSD